MRAKRAEDLLCSGPPRNLAEVTECILPRGGASRAYRCRSVFPKKGSSGVSGIKLRWCEQLWFARGTAPFIDSSLMMLIGRIGLMRARIRIRRIRPDQPDQHTKRFGELNPSCG